MPNKLKLSPKGKGLLIASFSFLFFIFAFGADAQTLLQASLWGTNNWQDPITVDQGTPLQLGWNFPGYTRCKFEENFGYPFGPSGTVSIPAYRSSYFMKCCNDFLCTNPIIDTVTINVALLPAGKQIYWDYRICDKQTNCQGMFVSAEAGYTQSNAQQVYDKLWPLSTLPHNWNSSLNAEIGLWYDNDNDFGFVQLVSLGGSWKRGIVYSYKDQKVFLASAEGNWGDDSFLHCYPEINPGGNLGVWAPLGGNPGGNMPTIYSQASKRSVCDLFGAAHPNAYDISGGWQDIRWYNDLTIGFGDPIPGWNWLNIFIMRMDGIHAIPSADYSNWWFETPTHYECTESKTCQIAPGSGPSTCSTDIDCGTLPTFNAYCKAIPDFGPAPLYDVSVEAWTEGTAQGDIVYRFDCGTGDGWGNDYTLIRDPNDPDPNQGTGYTALGICDYSLDGSYSVKVEASQSGLVDTADCSVDVQPGSLIPAGEIIIEGKGPTGSFSSAPITVGFGDDIEIRWKTSNVHDCQAFNSTDMASWAGPKPDSGGPEIISDMRNTTTFNLTCLEDISNQPIEGSFVVNVQFKPWWKEVFPW